MEAGLPGFEAGSWFGVLAPAGTPQPIVDELHAAIVAAMNEPEMPQRFAELGAEPVGAAPAEFAASMRAETEQWGKVAEAAGARLE